MPFCKNCNKEKMEMDMTFDDLCKNCFIKNENDFWKSQSIKGIKTKKKKEVILIE